jgi:hypothetical protein
MNVGRPPEARAHGHSGWNRRTSGIAEHKVTPVRQLHFSTAPVSALVAMEAYLAK